MLFVFCSASNLFLSPMILWGIPLVRGRIFNEYVVAIVNFCLFVNFFVRPLSLFVYFERGFLGCGPSVNDHDQ